MPKLFRKSNNGKGLRKVEHITFWSVLFKREVFERIGLLNEDLFWGWEDFDFAYRVKQMGIKILYCPDSLVFHKRSGNSNSQLQYYSARNKFYIMQKYVSHWQYILFVNYMKYFHTVFAFIYYVLIKRNLEMFLNFCSGVNDGKKGLFGRKQS